MNKKSKINSNSQIKKQKHLQNRKSAIKTEIPIQKSKPQIHLSSSKENILYNLKLKVLKKIYTDLFTSNPSIFKSNNLTFDNFIFEFAETILNYPKTLTYSNLLYNTSTLINNKYSLNYNKLSPLEKKHYNLKQKKNDEWALISKYQDEIYKEEEYKRLIKSNQNIKHFYNELKVQEEEKKHKKEEEQRKKQIEQERKYLEEEQKIINERKDNDKKIKQLIRNEKIFSVQLRKDMKGKDDYQQRKEELLKDIIEENEKLSMDNNAIVKMKIEMFTNMQNNEMSKISGILNDGEESLNDDKVSGMVDNIIEFNYKRKVYDLISSHDRKIFSKDEKIKGINEVVDLQVNRLLNEKEEELDYNKYDELLCKYNNYGEYD